EGLHFHAREEVRQRVAGGEHRGGVPLAYLLDGHQPAFVGRELVRTLVLATIEEPRDLVAARARGVLQRAQDAQRVTHRPVQQIPVVSHHHSIVAAAKPARKAASPSSNRVRARCPSAARSAGAIASTCSTACSTAAGATWKLRARPSVPVRAAVTSTPVVASTSSFIGSPSTVIT